MRPQQINEIIIESRSKLNVVGAKFHGRNAHSQKVSHINVNAKDNSVILDHFLIAARQFVPSRQLIRKKTRSPLNVSAVDDYKQRNAGTSMEDIRGSDRRKQESRSITKTIEQLYSDLGLQTDVVARNPQRLVPRSNSRIAAKPPSDMSSDEQA